MMLLAQKEFPCLNFSWLAKKLEKIFLVTIVIFFFFVFPIILLHFSLTSYFGAKEADLRQNAIAAIDKEMAIINEYSNNRIYYHNLFSKISGYAQISKSPEAYLKANFANLKNNYPGEFSFVVWDEKGKIINNLTDWPGYSYAFEKLYIILKEITQSSASNQELNIEELDIVKNNIKILKHVFGNTFLAKNLKYSLSNRNDAGPFVVDSSATLSTAWYSIKDKISFIVFISKSLLKEKSGLKKIIENSNNFQKNFISGYFDATNFDMPQTDFPDEYIGSLKLAVALCESVGESVYEDEKTIIKFSASEPSIRTFVCYRKIDDCWKKENNIRLWSMFGISVLILFYIICGYLFFIKKKFLSLRWKLIALFLSVNLVPSVVVGCIIFDFLSNKKSDLRDELFKNITSELRSIDAKSNDFLVDFENGIQNNFKKLSNNFCDYSSEKEKFEAFEKNINKFIETSIIVVASDSRLIFYSCKNKEFNKSTVKAVCESLLCFSNNMPYSNTGILGDALQPENCEFVRNVNANKDRIVPLKLNFFALPGLCYFNFIKDKNNNYHYCVFLFWNAYEFNKTLISEHYEELKSNSELDYLGFKCKQNNYLIGDSYLGNDDLNNYNSKNICEYIDEIDDICVLSVVMNSDSFQDWKLVGACSDDSIRKENFIYIVVIIAVIIVSFGLCFVLAYIVFINFLCPISNLNTALIALKKGCFDHKITEIEDDEFGYLEKILNRIIENFGELKIAQDFQLALASKNKDMKNLRVYGKTEIMTTMGGDYYDSFVINDEYSGIIIGDVAGHGVAAGLMMAMAKSGVITADEATKLNPSLMLSRLNEILLSVNCKKLKRMMTIQYLVFCHKNGSAVYANAGHCFPLIYDKVTQTIRELDNIGLPLGIKRKLSLKNNDFRLNKNEYLILYTDGTFEFTEKNNEKFKFEKLKEMLGNCFDEEPEKFYENLNGSIKEKRIGNLEDDTTIVIANWGEK